MPKMGVAWCYSVWAMPPTHGARRLISTALALQVDAVAYALFLAAFLVRMDLATAAARATAALCGTAHAACRYLELP